MPTTTHRAASMPRFRLDCRLCNDMTRSTAAAQTGRTADITRAVVLRAESTAPHDPRLPELSVEPHVSHLSSVMPIPAIVLSLIATLQSSMAWIIA